MTSFLNTGFIDSFRYFNPEARDEYTWWSYRFNARKNNKGWRIDYCMASVEMENRLKNAYILPDVYHSISLSGKTPPNPFLDILGECRVMDTLIQVRINGPLPFPAN